MIHTIVQHTDAACAIKGNVIDLKKFQKDAAVKILKGE